MADPIDLEKPRRNLLVVSCVLIFVQVAGIQISAVNVPGLAVSVQRPELLVPFVWAMFAYSLWRFWLLAKPHHKPFSVRANKYTNRCPHVIASIEAGGFVITEDLLQESHPELRRNFFNREVRFYIRDDAGGIVPEMQRIKVPYCANFLPELLGDLKSIPADREFVEFTLPFAVALVPVALVAVKILVHISSLFT